MCHVVCTLLQWLLTTVPVMASPPIEVRDCILLLSTIDLKPANEATNLAPERPAYKDAMYYVDGADLDTERTYDANGNMVSNADRQITRICYDQRNQPRRISYLDSIEYLDGKQCYLE